MGYNSSTNMLLPIPQVGNEAGPQYATDVNNCLTLIDQHDHSPGYGVRITPAGIDVNQDFDMGGQNVVNLRSLRLASQGAGLSQPTDLDCVYVVADDLYYNDGVGNQIRITQSGGVAGTPGSISSLIPPASASYSVSQQKFIFQSAANTAASIDARSIILRNSSSGSNGLTLSPPASMPADYDITLPSLPASTLPVSMSALGVLSTGQITLAQLTTAILEALEQPGVVKAYGGTTPPAGYLLCDGSAVSRATYSVLYAVIGDAFGNGDGSSTFNVPDVRGLFLRGVTGASANDPDASSRTASNPGGNTGNAVGSYQVDDFGAHSHVINSGSAAGGGGQSGLTGSPSASTLATGGNETRPKNLYVNYIIKT